MGDRTYAVYRVNAETANDFLDKLVEHCTGESWKEGEEEGGYSFHDANYGNIEEIEQLLIAAGIPFFHEWGSGGDYNAGSLYTSSDGIESVNLTSEGHYYVDAAKVLQAMDSGDTTYTEEVRKSLAFVDNVSGDIATKSYSKEEVLCHIMTNGTSDHAGAALDWLIGQVDIDSMLIPDKEQEGTSAFGVRLIDVLTQSDGLFSAAQKGDDKELNDSISKIINALSKTSANLTQAQSLKVMSLYNSDLKSVSPTPSMKP